MVIWHRPERELLSIDDERAVTAAIRGAERWTSGEIRVHIEETCDGDAGAQARAWFERLGMTATSRRNGVLIYLATRDRAFAIVGDEGIHRHVGDAFWEGRRDRLAAHFAAGRFAEGLAETIAAIGEQLARLFPRDRDDLNELPDEISYDRS